MSGRSTGRVAALIATQRQAQRRRLRLAAAAGAVVSVAAVGLLGLSGWFITGAAFAGAAGGLAVQSFNYLTPSAIIRLLAILRTGWLCGAPYEWGEHVIIGKEAKKIWGSEYGQLDGFTRLDKPDYRVDHKNPLSKVLGKDAPVPTLIVHPSSGELVAVVATDELDKALKAKGLITPAQASAKSKMTKQEDAKRLLEKVEKTWRKMAIAKVHELGSGRSPLGLSVPLCKLIALRLVPSLRGDERAVYGELFGIGKVAQREGIEDHVRACTADNIDLVCMVLLSLHDMLYLVQYQDGKASPTPHIDAVAADLEIDLQVIKDQVKELLKPKAKKPAAVATKKAATKPGAMDIKDRGPNGETWTGRGQQPAWVKAALKRGQTLQQLLNAAARKDVTSAAEAQAGIAAALQQLPADPVKPAPAGKKVKGAKS